MRAATAAISALTRLMGATSESTIEIMLLCASSRCVAYGASGDCLLSVTEITVAPLSRAKRSALATLVEYAREAESDYGIGRANAEHFFKKFAFADGVDHRYMAKDQVEVVPQETPATGAEDRAATM